MLLGEETIHTSPVVLLWLFLWSHSISPCHNVRNNLVILAMSLLWAAKLGTKDFSPLQTNPALIQFLHHSKWWQWSELFFKTRMYWCPEKAMQTASTCPKGRLRIWSLAYKQRKAASTRQPAWLRYCSSSCLLHFAGSTNLWGDICTWIDHSLLKAQACKKHMLLSSNCPPPLVLPWLYRHKPEF